MLLHDLHSHTHTYTKGSDGHTHEHTKLGNKITVLHDKKKIQTMSSIWSFEHCG